MINALKITLASVLTTVVFAIAVFVSSSGAAVAQAPGGEQGDKGAANITMKFAVVDIQAVRSSASAMKDIRGQMTKFRDAIQGDIQKEEVELRKANDELARKRSIMEAAAFEAERKKFEQRVIALQRHVQQSKQAMDRVQAEATIKIDKALLEVITGIVRDESLTFVFHKSATVASIQKMDISALALKRLNEKLPTVKVANPEAAKK